MPVVAARSRKADVRGRGSGQESGSRARRPCRTHRPAPEQPATPRPPAPTQESRRREPGTAGARAGADTARRPGGASQPPHRRPRPCIASEPLPEAPPDLAYVIVNEAGASVYSASPVGREEFPDFDATLRGTISIGRRLQDPLSELVKIDPQHVGVGLYQHDVNPKQLRESLEGVIESCVNTVGVDLNTASVPLLRHVSGMNQLVARDLVEYRKTQRPVPPTASNSAGARHRRRAASSQAAGFLKITERRQLRSIRRGFIPRATRCPATPRRSGLRSRGLERPGAKPASCTRS